MHIYNLISHLPLDAHVLSVQPYIMQQTYHITIMLPYLAILAKDEEDEA